MTLNNKLHSSIISGPNGEYQGDLLVDPGPPTITEPKRLGCSSRELSDKDEDRATAIMTGLEKAESGETQKRLH
jgi:hypothetical protein